MHHSLKIYSKYRGLFLRYYIFQARWTKIPLIGSLVRKVANLYGQRGSSAYLLTLEEANRIVDSSEGLALGPCTCRTVFRNCSNPVQAEIMLGHHRQVFKENHPEEYREITREEAKKVLKECHELGLIQTIIKCRQDYYALCNCCTCCCVPMRLKKDYGIGKALVRDLNIVEKYRAHQLT